jgi:hypothetical protein
MSMNFNKSGSPPPPPPKKNNDKIKMIIGVIAGISAAVLILIAVMNAQNNMEHVFAPSYEGLTVDQITNLCIERLRDMFDTEPNKISVNVCVETVLEGLNK